MQFRRLVMASVVVALVGCGGGGGGGGTDSGVTPEDGGGGGGDAGGATLPVASIPTGTIDLSCMGSRMAPTAGAAISFTAHFTEAVSGSTLPAGTEVQFYPSNMVAADCTGDCVSGMADASGNVMPMLPASGWFAYRVVGAAMPATADPVETIAYNRAAPDTASATAEESYISQSTINVIPSLFVRDHVPDTTIVSGEIVDCNDEPIVGAQVHVFAGGTEVMTGGGRSDPFAGYFMGTLPSRAQHWTDASGRFAFANVPGTDPLRVELWAVTADGMEPTRIACEEVAAAPNAIIIITEGPMRGDYAAGSGCAM